MQGCIVFLFKIFFVDVWCVGGIKSSEWEDVYDLLEEFMMIYEGVFYFCFYFVFWNLLVFFYEILIMMIFMGR